MIIIDYARMYRKKLPMIRQMFKASFRERLHWHATTGTMSEFTPDRKPRQRSAWSYTKFILTISGVYIGLVIVQMIATVMAMHR